MKKLTTVAAIAALMLTTVAAAARARPGDLAPLPPAERQDELGVRDEENLGTPDCAQADVYAGADQCWADAWLTTRSPNFVNIKKTAYLLGDNELPQGVGMNASFVAVRDGTTAAIVFSAETYVDGPGRMFVRALVDGSPAKPGDVVFATSDVHAVREFIFTTTVARGIHTVEMQWLVDRGSTASMRDATLAVRTGRSTSVDGSLVAATAPSGRNLELAEPVWTDVPDMAGSIWVPAEATLTGSFSAESFVSDGKAIAVRALVDGVPLQPSDVVFARGSRAQSRTMTFGTYGLPEGWHQVRFQWFAESGGTATMGDRSYMLAAYPFVSYQPTHPFVAAPSGPNVPNTPGVFGAVPDMHTTIHSDGNGEAAVLFSGEISASSPVQVVLTVDGIATDDGVIIADGQEKAHLKSTVFEVKGLDAGWHTLEVKWLSQSNAAVGDRTLAVVTESGQIPDLAEAPPFGPGRPFEMGGNGGAKYHIGGIEPLIGSRDVLTIQWDPHRCVVGQPCVDQDDVTTDELRDALYGPAADNVADLFEDMSGGRFTIDDAGVLGPYDALQDDSWYWNHPWNSCDTTQSGFTSGHTAKLAEAVRLADPDVDFSAFDRNADGVLETNELGIVIAIPQATPTGSGVRNLLSTQCKDTWMTLDGVRLPQKVVEWYGSLDDQYETHQFSSASHELLHMLGGLDDMYVSADHAAYPRDMSIMADNRWTSTHLDPMHKLALGWVTPRYVSADGTYHLRDVEDGDGILVLPRLEGALGEEYLLVENRRPGDPFDDAISDAGIAVWHIVDDPQRNKLAPRGVRQSFWDTTAAASGDEQTGMGTQARWGIRLLRPWDTIGTDGVAVFSDKDETLWDSGEYDLASGGCPGVFMDGFFYPNTLTWTDCMPSGYAIGFASGAMETMSVEIEVP